jgi:uncharacterized protein (TIGR02996 family)
MDERAAFLTPIREEPDADTARLAFADWLAEHRPRVLPKSVIGKAFTYATNQWPSLGEYLTEDRRTIDNAAAERAIRPLCVRRRNWLHVGGEVPSAKPEGFAGLESPAVLLSVTAPVKRHGIEP